MAVANFQTSLPSIDLEKLRPFSAPVINPPTPLRPGQGATDPNSGSSTTEPALAVLTWSARAGVQVTDLPSLQVILPSDADDDPYDFSLLEVTRETETKRVFNVDDDTQFVDVETVKNMTLTNKLKQSRTFTFNND